MDIDSHFWYDRLAAVQASEMEWATFGLRPYKMCKVLVIADYFEHCQRSHFLPTQCATQVLASIFAIEDVIDNWMATKANQQMSITAALQEASDRIPILGEIGPIIHQAPGVDASSQEGNDITLRRRRCNLACDRSKKGTLPDYE